MHISYYHISNNSKHVDNYDVCGCEERNCVYNCKYIGYISVGTATKINQLLQLHEQHGIWN